MKISIIQPSRNNLKYLKWSYESIRKNQGDHEVEICIADDFSDDRTNEWCQQMVEKDPNFKWIRNHGPERKGHTILYDELVNEVASHDLCMIFHADMYLCPGALDSIEKHMYGTPEEPIVESRIVSLTRIEPPLHPPGPEKVIHDCGIEPEEFKEKELLQYIEDRLGQFNDVLLSTTEGIFAPWAFWKEDFQAIGGHDPIFAPQSKEDSDIFNRFQLNGVEFIQTWEGFVYHMTCRGSRFADGAKRNPNGEVFMKNRETDEWLAQNGKSTREFIRKWGHMVKHDQYMKPIIPPKYNIGIRAENCSLDMLYVLEPWCSTIYTDVNFTEYIEKEQLKTSFDLLKRVHQLTGEDKDDYDDIIVNINGKNFQQEDLQYIQQLSEILQTSTILEDDYGCEFEVGNLKVMINSMETYENDLIINKKKEDKK